jgi:putative ABC transport system permease protein
MQTILQDLRYAGRQLRHSPEFMLLAVLTLALGVGANAGMFTVVESVLLRPLPYADSDRLVNVGAERGAVSWLDYLDIRNQSHTLANVAAFSNDVAVVQNKGASLSVVSSEVTPNLFGILGSRPLKGRTFIELEGEANGPRAVLISEGFWRHVLDADPDIVGRTLRVNGRERTIVGVMPGGFRFPESAGKDIEKGLWLPMQPTPEMLQERGAEFFTILAKSAPTVKLPQVQSELGVIAENIRDSDSRADRKLTFRAQSYTETVTGPAHDVLCALSAALGLVLLIVCANVANLLIARCLGRQHEFAVRAALGSGRGRLVGQLIIEAGLLSVLGCTFGLLFAYWISAAVHSLPAGTIPRGESIDMRWTVLLVLAAIATATTLLSALLPALLIVRTDAQTVLRTGSRSVGHKLFRARVGSWLVGGEVALSVLLLIATGLLFRTLWGLEHARLGFETSNVTSFVAMPADTAGFGNMTMNSAGTASLSVAATVYQPLLEGLRHTPGFQDAALVSAPPFSGFDFETTFSIVGWPPSTQQDFHARLTALSGRYEELMATPVVRGRSITEQDAANAPFVAVINEMLAHKYFGDKEALGQQLNLGGSGTGMLKPYTIVGVIGDQTDDSTSQPPQPLLMLPYQQIPPASLFYPALLKTAVHFVVKTQGTISAEPAARAIFGQVAPDLAVDNFQTLQEAVDQSNFGSRLGLYLIGAFAGFAVLMVIGGLYGLLSQLVGQRRREFGVRMALGATRSTIIRMVLQRGSAIIALGVAGGLTLALSFARLTRAFLYGVKPVDAASYVFAVIALFMVGALAALVPAWRAASFEPMKSLRDE